MCRVPRCLLCLASNKVAHVIQPAANALSLLAFPAPRRRQIRPSETMSYLKWVSKALCGSQHRQPANGYDLFFVVFIFMGVIYAWFLKCQTAPNCVRKAVVSPRKPLSALVADSLENNLTVRNRLFALPVFECYMNGIILLWLALFTYY